MKKAMYIEPDIHVTCLVNGDILVLSNDEQDYNDPGNYFEDSYL